MFCFCDMRGSAVGFCVVSIALAVGVSRLPASALWAEPVKAGRAVTPDVGVARQSQHRNRMRRRDLSVTNVCACVWNT